MRHIYMALIFVLCSIAAAQAETTPLKLSTMAFAPESSIPAEYTCDGGNQTPALTWQGVPAQTKSLSLIVEDPDAPAGLVTHWVVYDIPPTIQGLSTVMPEGARQGKNTMAKNAYDGPCPPQGDQPHRYYFWLYALDNMIDLPPATTDGAMLKAAMQGHILAQSEVLGRYKRQ